MHKSAEIVTAEKRNEVGKSSGAMCEIYFSGGHVS